MSPLEPQWALAVLFAAIKNFKKRLGVNPPEYLHKYSAVTDYRLQSIEKNEIFLSYPTTFNDPWDLQLNVEPLTRSDMTSKLFNAIADIDASRVEMNGNKISFVDGKTIDYGPAALEAIVNNDDIHRFMFESAGIHSLSADPSNSLLWSYYAQGHSGLVIAYRTTGCEDVLKAANLELLKVRYRKKFVKLRKRDLFLKLSKYRNTMLTTKGDDWRHENEWRLVGQHGNKMIKCPFPIDYVAIGRHTPLKDRIRIFEVCKAKGVLCAQAFRRHDAYSMLYWPLYDREDVNIDPENFEITVARAVTKRPRHIFRFEDGRAEKSPASNPISETVERGTESSL